MCIWGLQNSELPYSSCVTKSEIVVLPHVKLMIWLIFIWGGPRQCIGSRFAITLMKVASAKLLTRYRIVEVPGETGTMWNPKTKLNYSFTTDIDIPSRRHPQVQLMTNPSSRAEVPQGEPHLHRFWGYRCAPREETVNGGEAVRNENPDKRSHYVKGRVNLALILFISYHSHAGTVPLSSTMAVAPSWPLATRELIYTLSPSSVKLGFEVCEELTLRWR